VESGVPIVLAACPAADDIYDVAPSHVTAWAYKTLKVPLFFARGLGYSPIPKPTKLTHLVSEPLYPPNKSDDPEEMARRVTEFHKHIVDRMERLMKDAVQATIENLA
jgi:hypothetical protein